MKLTLNVLLCSLATAFCLAGVIALSVMSSDVLAAWVVRVYGAHGALSAEGWQILNAIIVKARRGLTAAAMAGAVGTVVLWQAEHRAARGPHPAALTSEPERGPRITMVHRAALVVLVTIALAVAAVHARDSFYGDEMHTVVLVAPGSIAQIFGLHMVASANAPSNHILNSLLTHLMLQWGFRSEIALRAWSLAALAALVPCTYWVARRLDVPSGPALAASALVATCPTLARYAIAVRGYELAALFATMAIGFHACWLHRARRRFSVLTGLAATLSVLANVFTLPVFIVLLVHTLFLPFDPRGVRPWQSGTRYNAHVTSLLGFLVLGLLLHGFMLPHLLYGSVVQWTARQMSVRDLLALIGAPLSPGGSRVAPVIGVVALGGVLLSAGRVPGTRDMRRTGAVLLLLVALIGLTAFVAAGQTGERMVIYLAPALLIMLARELSPDDVMRRPFVGVASVLACVAVCAAGVWWSASRPPLSVAGEKAKECENLAAGKPIWTSTQDAATVSIKRFYLPQLRVARGLSEIPSGPTVYYRLWPRMADDPVLALVEARCRIALRFGGPGQPIDETLYACPPLAP